MSQGGETQMRFFFLLLIIALPGCGGGTDLETSRLFEESCRTFEKAETPNDFLRSAAGFRALQEKGLTSGAILYNLGNAYIKAQKLGMAIAAYRQAKRYRPRDPYLQSNLEAALASRKPSPAEPRSLLDHVFFWQKWVSYREKVFLFAAGASVGFLFGLCLLAFPRHRPLFRRSAIGTLAVALLLGISLARDFYDFEIVQHGVITESEVTAYKGSSESYEPAFTESLNEGTEFIVLEERKDWLQIELPGNLRGWIPRNSSVVY